MSKDTERTNFTGAFVTFAVPEMVDIPDGVLTAWRVAEQGGCWQKQRLPETERLRDLPEKPVRVARWEP